MTIIHETLRKKARQHNTTEHKGNTTERQSNTTFIHVYVWQHRIELQVHVCCLACGGESKALQVYMYMYIRNAVTTEYINITCIYI